MEKEEHKELGERASERKRSWEEASDVDTFCWPVYKSHEHDSCMFCFIDPEEGSEGGEVWGGLSRSKASPELNLSSPVSNEWEFFCVDSDVDGCVSPVSVASSPWCRSDRGEESDVHLSVHTISARRKVINFLEHVGERGAHRAAQDGGWIFARMERLEDQ